MEIKIAKKEATGKVKEAQDALEAAIEKNTKEAAENKDYQAMLAKYKKSLTKINKDASGSPWEWSWGLDYLVEFLRFMKDYYTLGVNVWAMERKNEDPKRYKNVPTRLETLTKTLEYYDKWQGLEDEYIKVIDHPETYKEHDNGDGTVTIDDLGCHCEYKFGPKNNTRKAMKITYKKLAKAQEKYKKLFFMSLAEHMEEWWD